ncbi:hypothetical protein E2C01_100518 [Portunus trituberculatus]|uniref:Uncharacterized protein n=1 Tax=Portunus trituberculatus TaxID=210409 RepID=A0A5B7KI60_PORTR|nr:hypothetical protein [Portunus trituberculatus]
MSWSRFCLGVDPMCTKEP